MDKKGWVGGLKFAIFVHIYHIMSTRGRWVVKKDQNYVHVVIECPLRNSKLNKTGLQS